MLITRTLFRWIPILGNCLRSRAILSPALFQSCGVTHYKEVGRTDMLHRRHFSEQTQANLSRTQRLKLLIKEYGPLAMGLYLTIGFISIGACYAVISVGVNVEGILNYFGMEVSKKTAGFSTLAVAYLMHKLLFPLRIGLTLGGVPVIARYLRKKGWMKPGMSRKIK